MGFAWVAGSSGFRVASQKSGLDAGEMPSQARQHTQLARKEPRTRPRGVAWADSGPQGKDQRLSFANGPSQRKDDFVRDRAARASPELIPKLAPEPFFCPVEKCPADIFRLTSRDCGHSRSSARRSFISKKRWYGSVGLGSKSNCSYQARASSSLACTSNALIPAMSAAWAVRSSESFSNAFPSPFPCSDRSMARRARSITGIG